jgi:ATPase family associated with various cellular activities (AAA)
MAPKKQNPRAPKRQAKPAPVERAQPAGYADSASHLRDHLERIDLLVKAQTVRWTATIGASKPEEHWGMVHVTDAEMQVFLHADFDSLGAYPEAVSDKLAELDEKIKSISARINQSERNTDPSTPLALRTLQQAFSLSEIERDVLLVCLLSEWDPRYRRLYGYLQDDATRTQPTIELVSSILSTDGNGLDRIRPCLEDHRPLVSNWLVAVRNRHDEPLPVRSLRVDDRIAAHLFGSNTLDARLLGVAKWADSLQWNDLHCDTHYSQRLQRIARWYREDKPEHGAALLLRGVYGTPQSASARALSTELAMPLLILDVPRALRPAVPWDETVLLAFREAVLRGAALYWAGLESLLAADQPPAHLDDLVSAAERYPGLVIFGSQTVWHPGGRFQDKPLLHLELGIPTYAHRLALWKLHMPAADRFAQPTPDRDALADALAARFQLTEGQVLDAIRAAEAHALLRDSYLALLPEDLYEGCRRQAGRRLLSFARRIEPRLHLSLSDLVLPEANRRQLRDVQHRIRSMQRVHSELGFEQRLRLGDGMVVLFTGASGTGKTMAAECLARDLGVDLYKVDLSSIMSKYVGETEKNLQQLFTEAEDSSAIIFFDEADALFGKRGEVKDARDRWANAEVNYLLQRIEDYAGVVILASNLRQNIDEAFLRRISAMVEFPAPNESARVQIWRGMFPPDLKGPSDEELELLASRIKVPGGSIRNIVVDAAFRATAAGPGEPVVTLQHLVLASAREFQKLGKPLTKTEFGDEFYRWIEKEIL